eukprot:267925_1
MMMMSLLFLISFIVSISGDYLSLHNAARRQVGVRSLQRSSGLVRSAQKGANYLCTLGQLQHTKKGYCTNCRPYSTGENVGGHGNIDGSVKAFIAEKQYWHNGRCQSGKLCGHYTQVISSNTNYVGCAVKKCAGNGMSGRVVCHYSANARLEADEEGQVDALESTQNRNVSIVIAVAIGAILIIGALVALWYYKKKKSAKFTKAMQVLDEEEVSEIEVEVEAEATTPMNTTGGVKQAETSSI